MPKSCYARLGGKTCLTPILHSRPGLLGLLAALQLFGSQMCILASITTREDVAHAPFGFAPVCCERHCRQFQYRAHLVYVLTWRIKLPFNTSLVIRLVTYFSAQIVRFLKRV